MRKYKDKDKNIDMLPSGSFRVRKMVNGRSYSLVFDHKPKNNEIDIALSELIKDTPVVKGSFGECVEEYIKSKNNILSPTTITSYRQIKRQFPEWLLKKSIDRVNQLDIQKAVNEYSVNHSAKSVKNYHGLIASVIKVNRPNMALNTTLPKGKPFEAQVPEHDDIIRILKELEGTEYHIPIQLGCLGLRRGEILALGLDDLEGDVLTIDKAKVLMPDGSYKIKELPKNLSSIRKVIIPDKLAEEIRKNGYIYKGYPAQLLKALHRAQDRLEIPRCRFHDLRHYYASYAHSLGMSDADIMASGGWKTDEVMKRVYRHSLANRDKKKYMANSLVG